MAKTPETTIDTLDMGDLCNLTLTNRHLRGGVTKLFPNGVRQKDQIDVLLSGLAGYSVTDISRKMARIQGYVWGTVIALGGYFMDAVIGVVGTLIGAAVILFVWKFIKDVAVFELNVMGNKTAIPIKLKDADRVRTFITKIQNAKIEYEEANA